MKVTLKSKHYNITKGGEKKMRYSKIILAFGAAGLILATLITSWAAEDVINTKHNLSSTRDTQKFGNTVVATGTTEVCVFCHTPHGGQTDVAGGGAPIWNRALSSYGTGGTQNYTLYTSPNFETTNNSGQPDGVSLACLSCHDGTVAFDALINAPGSGGYNGANFGRGGTSIGLGMSGTYVDPADSTFNATAEPFPNLGTNLSNDHPITMEICKSDNTAYDPQFTDACGASSQDGNILKIKRSDGSFPTDKRNAVRAYRTKGDQKGWYVECASCHNPHEATSTRFLRHPSASATATSLVTSKNIDINIDRNAGSLLCLSCHQK